MKPAQKVLLLWSGGLGLYLHKIPLSSYSICIEFCTFLFISVGFLPFYRR